MGSYIVRFDELRTNSDLVDQIYAAADDMRLRVVKPPFTSSSVGRMQVQLAGRIFPFAQLVVDYEPEGVDGFVIQPNLLTTRKKIQRYVDLLNDYIPGSQLFNIKEFDEEIKNLDEELEI